MKEAAKKVYIQRNIKERDNTLGYNKDIKKMIKTRREACHKWKNENDKERRREYEEEYKKIRSEIINEIERCEGEKKV